ncbi:hypothetical protein BLS_002151 [Venturia inaequalis]|uniref:Uncharacterized protein n=1 Tax=Venturia inaequalis TaxID=5025 RepID=A0A8H3U1D0_VENIN|nr:hypothetical protein BLS_002151 [Venturia inaequalis]
MSNQTDSGPDRDDERSETLDGSTLVPTESTDSDASWGNTGPAPWDNGSDPQIRVAEGLANTANEDPELFRQVISSGDRARAARALPDAGDEEDEEEEEEEEEGSEGQEGEGENSEGNK